MPIPNIKPVPRRSAGGFGAASRVALALFIAALAFAAALAGSGSSVYAQTTFDDDDDDDRLIDVRALAQLDAVRRDRLRRRLPQPRRVRERADGLPVLDMLRLRDARPSRFRHGRRRRDLNGNGRERV